MTDDYGRDPLAVNGRTIADFRASRGTPDNPYRKRAILLLTTKGRRTGRERTSPMMYIPEGDRILVLASNAGAASHPGWYHNLRADPNVRVEVGDDIYDATAAVTTGDEHARVWAYVTSRYPFFNDHQAKVTRRIPIVSLRRRVSPMPPSRGSR